MAESIGQFQVLSELGKGAHSTIYQIRRHSDSKQFALKVVPILKADDGKFREQAEHEFRVAQMLNHPNLIKIYALEYQRNWLFRVRKVHLLIEFVKGKTLDQAMKLSTPWLVQIFAKVAEGLAHMHRRGVYHADLKPNNIMLSDVGDVRIIDFGLAWIKGEPKERVQGTPEYMAPEQSKNTKVNERTDIYNFGATMYRLTTGKLPPNMMGSAGGSSINSKLLQGLLKPVKELAPATPDALCALIHRCLEYDPKRRPERVGEVLDELVILEKKLVRSDEDRLEAIGW
jgi:eukaryotic-like serine/threonine-protein kinase